MVTAISGLAGTSKNSFTIGDGLDGYKYIYINNDLLFTAGIRYNNTDEYWELSNDGAIWIKMDLVSPGYLGDDGYVLTMVAGVPDWSPLNQIIASQLIIGDNSEAVVSIEFKTLTDNANLIYDSISDEIYLNNVNGLQKVILSNPNDFNTIALGDYSGSNVGIQMKTDIGDGYLIYDAVSGTIQKQNVNEDEVTYLVETELGDINTLVLGDYSSNITTVHMNSNVSDGYLSHDGYDFIWKNGTLSTTIAGFGADNRWVEIDPADYNAEPNGVSSITSTNVRLMNYIYAGDPLKWLSANPYQKYGDSNAQIVSVNMTGISKNNISSHGSLHLVCEEVLDPSYTWNIYKDASLSEGSLVAHVTFDDTLEAARTLIEDNGSGIGGTITNGAGLCIAGTIGLLFVYPLIVDEISNSEGIISIDVKGATLDTSGETIIGLWRGSPELVDHIKFHVDGYFGVGGITNTLLADNNLVPYQHRWGMAYIVEFGGIVINAGSSAAEINLINNSNDVSVADVELTTDWTWSTILSSESLIISRSSNDIEIALKVTGTNVESLDVEVTIVRL